MTPEELAKRHPRLYHVTEPGAWASIQRHGLLSTNRLLDLFEIEIAQRILLETKRRPFPVPLHHSNYESVILNDQTPLQEKALRNCLEDNLHPEDWLKLLNSRIFFWPTEEDLNRHLNARLNRTKTKEIIIVDTLTLAMAYAENIELCPINSGTTFRKAARRGKNTFAPLLKYSYSEWSKLRGQKDKIREVTVLNHIPDISKYVIDVTQIALF